MVARARKALLLTVGIFGGLLALLLGGLAVALMTTAGARGSLAVLAKFVPGELAVGGVAGSIANGLVLTDVRYESAELTAALARIQIDAELDTLLDGRAVFSRLAAESGTVTLHESESAPAWPSVEPPALPASPEWLAIRSLYVSDVALTGTANVVIEELAASVAGPRIALETLEAQAAGAQIRASGQALLRDDATARIEGTWEMPVASTDTAAAPELRVELGANIELATSTLPWRATVRWDRLGVQAAGTD